ncbi:MAG: hypothetical protein Q4P31_06665 [Andreesenia angusta]|nr:hypothetical protein [Andreesenia angusta]
MKENIRFKKKIFMILTICLTILSFSIVSFAKSNFNIGDAIGLESGKIEEGTAFYSGNNINIDGNINGNAFIAGQDINIRGNIDGNLFIAGNNINIEGEVKGTIFSAGNLVTIKSNSRDVFVAGNIINLDEGFRVERDLFMGGSNILLNGEVGRDLNLTFDKCDIGDKFKVKGDMTYESKNKISGIDSKVEGDLKYKKTEIENKKKSILNVFKDIVISILGLLLVWAIGIIINRRLWISNARTMKKNPLLSFGIGLATLILMPAIIIILMVTIIGLSSAIILSLLYGISIYISQIIISVAIGDAIFRGREIHYGIWGALLGLIIIKLLTLIPFAGFIINFMIICLGLGAIIINLKENRNKIDIAKE